jgi:plasmid stabilization system protein ParE
MIGSVQIHPAAWEELEAADEWYAQRSNRAVDEFLNDLRRAIQQMSDHLEQLPQFEFGTRRVVLRKFPYRLVFRETQSSVEIVAVAHGRRRPGYWRKRVS